jgi:hypothetical protein
MAAKKFRKKPCEILAVQWLGTESSFKEVQSLYPEAKQNGWAIEIQGLHGRVLAGVDDWIIKGSEPNDFYPCKPAIFKATYEGVPL